MHCQTASGGVPGGIENPIQTGSNGERTEKKKRKKQEKEEKCQK